MIMFAIHVCICVSKCVDMYMRVYIYIYMFDDDFVLYKSRMHEPVCGSRVSYAVSQ